MATTLHLENTSAGILGLDEILKDYDKKTFKYLQEKQDENLKILHKKHGTDIHKLLTNIKEILTATFVKQNDGLLREATYTAILKAINDGEFKNLRDLFTMSLSDVSGKLASSGVSIGRIVGTAYLQSKNKKGGRRRTRKVARRTRKMRSRK
jgi:succinate dehydrogenase flavin-adding protein (antitoxin of CptAB toxin-antitoxin module)